LIMSMNLQSILICAHHCVHASQLTTVFGIQLCKENSEGLVTLAVNTTFRDSIRRLKSVTMTTNTSFRLPSFLALRNVARQRVKFNWPDSLNPIYSALEGAKHLFSGPFKMSRPGHLPCLVFRELKRNLISVLPPLAMLSLWPGSVCCSPGLATLGCISRIQREKSCERSLFAI
jgi:hypothetical protein